MVKINLEEKLMYLILFLVAVCTRIFIYNDVELYSYIINSYIVTSIYIPMFLFCIVKSHSSMGESVIILRYGTIQKWVGANIKIIGQKSLKISIFFNIITLIFMVSANTSLIYSIDFYKFIYFSIIIQFIGWILVGVILLLIDLIIRNIKISYIIEVVIFISIKIIKSPISFIGFKDYIIPIWETMFFYNLDFINYKIQLLYLGINILIILIICGLYIYFYRKKDFIYER